jgi:hypothetical protein
MMTSNSIKPLIGRLSLIVILISLYVMRVPDLITNPQFWAEDGRYFFRDSLCIGFAAIFKTYQGYYHLAPRLTALFASFFDPLHAPEIFFGVTIILIAIVAYLVLSPRLQLPYKPVLALIMVTFPHAEEIYGNITNIQWYLALGMLTLVLLKPSASRLDLATEIVFFVLAGLTGPFMLLLLPVIALKGFLERKDKRSFERNLVLLAIGMLASAAQVYALLTSGMNAHGGDFTIAEKLNGKAYIMSVVTLTHLTTPFIRGVGQYLTNNMIELAKIIIMSIIFAIIIRSLIARESKLLFEKTALLYFAVVIIATALFKNIEILDTYSTTYSGKSLNGGRYFFIPGIMISWFLLIMLQEKLVKFVSVLLLALLLFSSANYYQRAPLQNYEWPLWANKAIANSSTWIPINPQGWSINMKCSEPN